MVEENRKGGTELAKLVGTYRNVTSFPVEASSVLDKRNEKSRNLGFGNPSSFSVRNPKEWMPGRPRKSGYPWGNPVQVSGICPNRTQNSRGMAKVPDGGDRRRPFGGTKFRIIRTDPSETKGIILE